MKRIIGALLILVGLGTVSYTMYMRYQADKANELLIARFEEILVDLDELPDTTDPSAETPVLPGDPVEEVPAGEPAPTSPSAPVKTAEELQKEREDVVNNAIKNLKVIGLITIPKIGVYGPIVEGIGDKSLKYAVGHFEGTGLPGSGNFALASHRNYTYAHYFRDIHKLKVGDEIRIKTKTKEYTYVVTGTKIVLPTAVDVLNHTDNATITLVTCTVDSTRRVIVFGKLK
ncbi:class D sortase [Youngiibacter fragilis]|uniref:Sortase n=1 Tax=Youngiibacter fragilis 232.1 TaxID=994573 RepID=V7I2G0_9CLOT|nr:class D sortase [Youngiibacter fragilis]ETA80053.1 sortase [Youngiibacter fragilis 232.1]